MKQLHHSGLPLYLDDDGVMVLKPPLNYLGFGRKAPGRWRWSYRSSPKRSVMNRLTMFIAGSVLRRIRNGLLPTSISTTSPSSCRERLVGAQENQRSLSRL